MDFDTTVSTSLLGLRSLDGIIFFNTITKLGGDVWIIVLAIMLPSIWWYYGNRAYAEGLWISIGGSEATSYLLKLLVARERPAGALFEESTYSFPSGHAVVAVALYGYLVWIVHRSVSSTPLRIALESFLVFVVILVGFSRLYLGVHYASDVAAGFGIGAAWLSFAIFRTRAKLRKRVSR